eukprot:2580391-Ditylum_brightwellii.AAC.1
MSHQARHVSPQPGPSIRTRDASINPPMPCFYCLPHPAASSSAPNSTAYNVLIYEANLLSNLQLKDVAAPSAALGLSWEIYLHKSTAAIMAASSVVQCQFEWPTPSITSSSPAVVDVGTFSVATIEFFPIK